MRQTQRWSQRRLRRSVFAAGFGLAGVTGGVAQLLVVRSRDVMNFIPKSYDGWRKFYYLIFRAYVLLALPLVLLVHSQYGNRHFRSDAGGAVDFIVLGYVLCFAVFTASSVQLFVRITRERIINLIFLILAVWFGFYLHRYYSLAAT